MFVGTGHVNPNFYPYGAYIACWTIYIVYLLMLMGKLRRLHQEEAELRAS